MALFKKIKNILFSKDDAISKDDIIAKGNELNDHLKKVTESLIHNKEMVQKMKKDVQEATEKLPSIIKPESLPRPVDVSEINIEVPEIMIQQAAGSIGGVNNFMRLLHSADIYREANLTPIYLTNASQTALRVIAREFLETPYMIN